MTYKELKQKQLELDVKTFICPKCKKMEDWFFYKNYGCMREFDKNMHKERLKEEEIKQ